MASVPSLAGNYYRDSVKVSLDGITPLEASRHADVCIVGGGVTGCSAALALAERGYDVVLLEARDIGYGASGRSGGQIITGLSLEVEDIEAQLGLSAAHMLWEMSREACTLVQELIATYRIPCDYRQGYLHAAIKPRQRATLEKHIEYMASAHHYHRYQWLDADALASRLLTHAYQGAMQDPDSGHLHPLNYTLGLARAAQQQGANLYTTSPVTAITPETDGRVTIATAQGAQVKAYTVIHATNAYFSGLFPKLDASLMRVPSYIVATAPLDDDQVMATIPSRDAVCDTNLMLDYYRLSADNRLLLGGRQSRRAATQRIKQLFPVLRDVPATHFWQGNVAVTRTLAPMFGRVDSNIYYAQGYCGHGMALATLAGRLLAEAIAGQAERFDVMGQFKAPAFPLKHAFHPPLLGLMKNWYRLRDCL